MRAWCPRATTTLVWGCEASEPVAGQYEDISKQLNTPPLVLAIAVKRLRQRFRELAEDELMETVASPADLATEREALASLLAGKSV